MILYFEKPGDYADQVFSIVQERLQEGDINQVLIATTSGKTALKAAEALKNVELIAITHQAGFRNPGEMEIPQNRIDKLKNSNVKVITATHALAGVDRAIRKKHGTWMTVELIAETLRTFGQGTKVCAEIAMMAADAGAIKLEDSIVIGGTGSGADTAWVIKPVHTHQFFKMKFMELLCKPK